MAATMKRVVRTRLFSKTSYCRLSMSRKKSSNSEDQQKNKANPSISNKSGSDWIGPADKVSNIRKFKYFIPDDETEDEKAFRLKREETQEWHHEFWSKHNKNFFLLKDDFVKQKLKEKRGPNGSSIDEERQITPEEMSEFYKKFLDDNYVLHKEYNKEWYKRNISLLWPAVKVKVKRLFMRSKTAG